MSEGTLDLPDLTDVQRARLELNQFERALQPVPRSTARPRFNSSPSSQSGPVATSCVARLRAHRSAVCSPVCAPEANVARLAAASLDDHHDVGSLRQTTGPPTHPLLVSAVLSWRQIRSRAPLPPCLRAHLTNSAGLSAGPLLLQPPPRGFTTAQVISWSSKASRRLRGHRHPPDPSVSTHHSSHNAAQVIEKTPGL